MMALIITTAMLIILTIMAVRTNNAARKRKRKKENYDAFKESERKWFSEYYEREASKNWERRMRECKEARRIAINRKKYKYHRCRFKLKGYTE
jgi:hypothetical protein